MNQDRNESGRKMRDYCASMLHRWLVSGMVLLTMWSCNLAQPACAQEGSSGDRSTAASLERFAKKVIAFLAEESQSAVVVGNLIPIGKRPIPGGPGLSAQLIATLNRIKPNVVSESALWTIEGNLLFGDDPADRGRPEAERNLATTVKFTVFNQDTGVAWSDTIVIGKLTETQVLVGANAQTSTNADANETKREVRRSIAGAPSIDPAEPSKVRPISGSPFALQLRAKPIGAETATGLPITATLEKRAGLLPATEQQFAFAKIDKNQEYEVVIYNESEKEIAAAIFIDGIDVFAFSEDLDPKTKKSLYTHFVIAPQENFVLPGWHQTAKQDRDDNFLAFLVTEYGHGARSRKFPQAAPEESVGAVTVAISHCFLPGDARAKSSSETGFGRRIKQDQKPVERVIDPAHAFITIRYDR